jgi:hypothetical protein
MITLEDDDMRKFQLLSAVALAALMAACAQTGETAQGNCDQLPSEAFLQAVDQGQCELDVTTAAGGASNEPKSFDSNSDHSDGGKEPDRDPEPDPDPEDGSTRASTEPATPNP